MKGWLKPKATAEYAGEVSQRTVYTWFKKDGLRYVKIKGTTLTKIEWVDEFLEKHEVNHGNAVATIVDEVMKGIE